MKTKIMKCLALVLAMTCILCFPTPASATAQGTDGTELEVVQPEKLEIQLGESWAGVAFELKTDAGMYPGVIPVGEDGILRLEIGGSTSYILTCMNSEVEIPEPMQHSIQREFLKWKIRLIPYPPKIQNRLRILRRVRLLSKPIWLMAPSPAFLSHIWHCLAAV